MNYKKVFLFMFLLVQGGRIIAMDTIFGEHGIKSNLVRLDEMINKIGGDSEKRAKTNAFFDTLIAQINVHFNRSTPLRSFLGDLFDPTEVRTPASIPSSKAAFDKFVKGIRSEIDKKSKEEVLKEVQLFITGNAGIAPEALEHLNKLKNALSKSDLNNENLLKLSNIFSVFRTAFGFDSPESKAAAIKALGQGINGLPAGLFAPPLPTTLPPVPPTSPSQYPVVDKLLADLPPLLAKLGEDKDLREGKVFERIKAALGHERDLSVLERRADFVNAIQQLLKDITEYSALDELARAFATDALLAKIKKVQDDGYLASLEEPKEEKEAKESKEEGKEPSVEDSLK